MNKPIPAALLAITFLILPYGSASAQMPDWKGFKDRDGNRYFYDASGKVWTLGRPVHPYKPVSAEGIEYYIHHGEELLKNRFQTDGLAMLKSILAMPASDYRILKAQEKASKIINGLIKKEGTRYPKLDFESALLLFRSDNVITVINEPMKYSLKVAGDVSVIRKRNKVKHGYSYQGFLLGIRKETGAKKDAPFDFLVAIDSEKYTVPVTSIDMVKEYWGIVSGNDSSVRTEIRKLDSGVVMEFKQTDEPKLSGLEGIFFERHFGYYVRMIIPGSRYDAMKDEMKMVMDSFTIVAGD